MAAVMLRSLCRLVLLIEAILTVNVCSHQHQDAPGLLSPINVNVQTDAAIHTTDERFLSVTIDVATFNQHYMNFNFSSPKVQALTRLLSPAFLRLSGTSTDFLFFKNPCQDKLKADIQRKETYMCPQDWDDLNNFCIKMGLKLIFGLNLLLRTADGTWNSSNAQSLFDYNKYDVAWELGNEPSQYPRLANISVSGSQIGRDFNSLRKILTSHSEYNAATVYGPDVIGSLSSPSADFLKSFYSQLATSSINASTFHDYYLNGATATLSDFLNPETLDKSLPQLITLQRKLATQYYGSNAKVWLGETGSAYGGGARNLSDRFVAGFLFLDKLGMSAKMGLDGVIRQSYYGGAYTMLDLTNLDPKPDYWIALLYKYLIGSNVLQVTTMLQVQQTSSGIKEDQKQTFSSIKEDDNYVRLYAHCTAISKFHYPPGAVTIIALNMRKTDTAVIHLTGQLEQQAVEQYLLTPYGPQGMTSLQVLLNNHLLELQDSTILPALTPVHIASGQPITMPPLSYGFYVIPKANAKGCV